MRKYHIEIKGDFYIEEEWLNKAIKAVDDELDTIDKASYVNNIRIVKVEEIE